jgi:hypothetical protein
MIEIDSTGNKWYWLNDDLHREDGPAVEWLDGSKAWFLHGKRHREDGPAIEYKTVREWWINGECHREDGPAIERTNGVKYWYYHGQRLDCKTQREFEQLDEKWFNYRSRWK